MSPRAQGFARGDLDTSFPLDDKFVALRALVTSERYYAATGVYFHVAAATWREAERKPASKLCPDADVSIGDLKRVGLLDDDECVTKRAFAHTIGRAKRARSSDSERKARNRAGMSGGTPADGRGTPAPSRRVRGTEQSSTEQSSTGQSSAADARDADPALEAYQRIVQYPTREALRFIDDIVERHGAEPTARAIGEAALQDPNRGTLLTRARAICALWERDAERRERADEHRRNGEKRAPVRLVAHQPRLSPEQIADEVARYDAEQAAARGAS